ncbi:Ig-like domain-containing protein [Luteolibacter soli]|uniref:Ig-like domain-containing protein n=1 Tax=Luteolibacter soli TaxID=3135280 RepID=A0ABU9ARP0_9BACT
MVKDDTGSSTEVNITLSMSRSIHAVILSSSCTFIAALHAGELRVDINRDSNNTATVTENGYTKWSPDNTNGAATGTNPVSRSFTTATGENVTITFAQTAASAAAGGTGLLTNWFKAGAEGSAKLVSDGLTVAPANLGGGGQLRMTVTGLSAGTHTLLTYHNAWDNVAAGTVGPIDIWVNGTQVIDNLQPTIRAASTIAATTAYLDFSVAGPSTVTEILFAAETNTAPAVTIRNAMINGFEIDTSNSQKIANTPSPAHANEHVDADSGSISLSWQPALAGGVASHDVYFGTTEVAVKSATRTSPEFLGNQAGTSRPVSLPNKLGTYYWRVDEIDSLGNIAKGTVWHFRPRLLAFPGAEGYGRFARGGRGGKVVHVTSLADYESNATPIPGTLRYAVEVETGPRVVVFDTAGLMTMNRRLTLSSPYVTIAGQTAPGKGICLRQWPLGLSGSNDSVVRFIRNRPGNISGQTIDGGGLAGCDHSIMDHCSISWSMDEGFSSRSGKNITLQKTLISEALAIAGHQNYPAGTDHGYAATVGGDIASLHHNLLAHCSGRNWSMGGGIDALGFFSGRLDIRNNVVYNWKSRTTDGGAMEVNFVNNYYKPGAATTLVPYAVTMNHENDFGGSQRCYFAGNVMQGYFNESNQTAGRRSVVSNGAPTPTYETFVSAPFFENYITTQTAAGAYKRVLSDVGANRPLDDHDIRVIQETLSGTYHYTGTGPYGGFPGLPNSQDDVGGWENYPAETRPSGFDSDGDGLPNWWEALYGTNPSSPTGDFSDANADPENDGYTRLCDYLAWMALPRLVVAPGEAVMLDLSTLTKGYTTSPVRSVQLPTASSGAGTLQLLPDGKTARFTAAAGFSGIARFTYTVTDSGGDSMTGEVGVQVTPPVGQKTAYETFCETYGLNPQTTGAPASDYDGDGLANAIEFLLGGDPTRGFLQGASPSASLDAGGTLVFSYRRKLAANGIFVDAVETSTGLDFWNEVVNGVGGATIQTALLDPETEVVTVRVPIDSNCRFARLKVSEAE